VVLGVTTARLDHLLDQPPLLDRGGFLLYTTYVRHFIFMDIKIYTSNGCKYCTQAKKLLQRAGFTQYEEISCPNKEFLLSDYPNATSWPWVIVDGKEIGGLVETARYFLEEGVVSSDKNERS
jgi:glutaredoxin